MHLLKSETCWLNEQPGCNSGRGSILRIKAPSEDQFGPAVLACARGQMYVKIHALSQSPSKSVVMLSLMD